MAGALKYLPLAVAVSALTVGMLPRAGLFVVSPGVFEDFIGDFLAYQFRIFLTILGFFYTYVVSGSSGKIILGVIFFYVLWKTITKVKQTGEKLLPELTLVLAASLIFTQFFADMSARLVCYMLLLGSSVLFHKFIGNVRLVWFLSVFAASLLGAMFLLDWAETISALGFASGVLAIIFLVRARRLDLVSSFVVILWLMPVCQILAAVLPGLFKNTHAHQFSDALAISYCESPKTSSLFVAYPQCPMAMFAQKCKAGYISEYDSITLKHRRDIKPFSNDYFARFEQLVCKGDELYVGMNAARLRGEILGPNTMHIRLTPTGYQIKQNFAGPQIGNHLMYDEKNDALFMTSEWDSRIYRWDFRNNKMSTDIGDALPNPWYSLQTGKMHSGSRISHHDAISANRRTGYFAEWINGRFVHELDLETLKLERVFRFNGGASVGVTIDEATDTLWISHLWGISVFDLKTGKLMKKHRLGFVTRPAVVDTVNNLIYVASTVQGRVHVIDRYGFRYVTSLALGWGTRYLLISKNMQRLFASSISGAYAFDLTQSGNFMKEIQNIRNQK